jgi:CBS domain-containing protein
VSLLRRQRIGSLPVVKDKKLVGIITRSDILDFVLNGPGKRPRSAQKKAGQETKKAKTKK